MFMPEEELAIEIAQIDCIEIDDVDFAEPGQDEVFEELTADPTCANKEDTRLDTTICVSGIQKARAAIYGCAPMENLPP